MQSRGNHCARAVESPPDPTARHATGRAAARDSSAAARQAPAPDDIPTAEREPMKDDPDPSAAERETRSTLPVYARLPFEPVSASGVNLRTSDGREILDFYGGHAVAALGYGHPRLTSAIGAQARELLFQSNAVALRVRAEAAEKLVATAPAGITRAFFVNSGGEANENALRIAFLATGRRKVVAVEHGFHGRTAAASAVTWNAQRWYAFPRQPFEVAFVPRDDPDAARAAVDDDTAAVIVEPVQGVAGAYDLAPGFLTALAEAAAAHGALLIVDEVQSGMGRSGRWWALERVTGAAARRAAADVAERSDERAAIAPDRPAAKSADEPAAIAPDMITSAKSLGGGLPCAALLTTEALAAKLGPGDLGTTFGGAPLAAAAIATVIDVIREDELLANVAAREAEIRARCLTGPVTSIQGAGLLLGLRCDRPAKAVRDALLEADILVGTSADPEVIRLLPPLVLESGHVERLAEALEGIGG